MTGGGSSNQVQETPQELKSAKNDLELWNYSQNTYKPYIDKYITQQTNNASSGQQAEAAKGQVNAEVMKGLSEATRNPRLNNPVAVTKAAEGAGDINATAQITAADKTKQRQLGTMQNIIDIGRGQQVSAQQAQSSLAADSLKTAIADKEADLATTGEYENAVGSIAGAGAAAYTRKSVNNPDIEDPFGTDFGRNNP
jgi:hypothetical protein